jgi:hypothetical protein
MRITLSSVLKWLMVIVAPLLLVLIIGDVWGWGTFLLDIIYATFVQALLALLLFGWLIVLSEVVQGGTPFASRPWGVKFGVFAACVLMIFPLMGKVFHRSVDIYDVGQTVIIIALGLLLIRSNFKFVRSPLANASMVILPSNMGLYQNLLVKVGGDKAVAQRLIEYERRKQPGADQANLIRGAITSWEQDNNR